MKTKNEINNFDNPTDKPKQYDIAREMYKTLQRCNEQEIQDKNKLPEKIIINNGESIEKGSMREALTAKNEIDKFDVPTEKPERYDIAQEMYQVLRICNKSKNKFTVVTKFRWHRFLKFLAVALVFSAIIFLALKFIFNVAAIWPLIIFPVIPALIFLVYTFFVKNKFIYLL